jgi:hypothetical protein
MVPLHMSFSSAASPLPAFLFCVKCFSGKCMCGFAVNFQSLLRLSWRTVTVSEGREKHLLY